MKKLILSLLIACLSLSGSVFANSYYGKQKVVYHVNYDDAQAQAGALRNIQNHINAVGKDSLDLRVVMHGNGVSLVLPPEELKGTKFKHANATPEIQAKISVLKGQGVKFEVCANTLKGKRVAAYDLYDVSEADVVPSGVAELARLQQMGYTYIRP